MSVAPVVSIVDEDDAYRSSLSLLISSSGFRVASYATASAFLAEFDFQIPGCVIIDVRMPEMSGLALQQTLAKRSFPPAVIVISENAEIPLAVRAMHQGAVDFLQKASLQSEVLNAIRRALARDAANRIDHARKASVQERMSQLSPPETEVLSLVLQGNPNKNIAARLGVSARTVEDRRARIMSKLRVDSVPKLVSLAILAGLRVDE